MKLKKRTHSDPVSERGGSDIKKEQIGRPMLLPVFFCLVSGVLLILLETLVLRITGYALAAGLIVMGIWLLIEYIRSVPIVRIIEAKLAIGLILLVTGAMLAFNPEVLGDLLPYAWGLALLFGGFLKIQYAFDRKSLGAEKWWILLILAAFSIIIGVISLLNPAFLADKKALVIGILLVSEAVLDLSVFLLLKRKIRKRSELPEQSEIIPKPQQDPDGQQVPEETPPETEAEGGSPDGI